MLDLVKGFQKMDANKDQTSTLNTLIGQLDRNFRKIEDGLPCGFVQLIAGTATVSDARVHGQSLILLTSQVDGGTPGFLRVQSRIIGTSFKIVSSNVADTSIVAWQIIK